MNSYELSTYNSLHAVIKSGNATVEQWISWANYHPTRHPAHQKAEEILRDAKIALRLYLG